MITWLMYANSGLRGIEMRLLTANGKILIEFEISEYHEFINLLTEKGITVSFGKSSD